ncbi:MAG: hypothetical protein AB7L17_24100, partial [Ilumatobacteraceae bacterium]
CPVSPNPPAAAGLPKGTTVYQHPFIARQLAEDRHEELRRQAGAARLRRDARAIQRQHRQRER